jgi:hypothetical protein
MKKSDHGLDALEYNGLETDKLINMIYWNIIITN